MAVVIGGKTAYLQAYGDARLEPKLAATPEMQYSVGSISKQFTAAAILLLQEQGKLSLDDHVSKYVPGLTRGNEVTIRQLLSHTSGYQDYWPQDYVMQTMLQPTTAQQILDRWAKIPLDFDPGTKWQYSNTNYVIAGLIVEKVAGMPLLELLHQRVFDPLGMKSIANVDLSQAPAKPIPEAISDTLSAASSRAERRQRMDFCCRRTRDERRGLGQVGHLTHRSVRAEASLLPRNGNRGGTE